MRHGRAVVPRCGRQTGDIDAYVGRRIEERRRNLHISQTALAQAMRLSLRQVRRYESGEVRLPPATLAALAEFLRAPVSYFFVDMTLDAGDCGSGRAATATGEAKPKAAALDGD